MLTKMKVLSRLTIAGILCFICSVPAQAGALHSCFDAPREYHINYDRELQASENIAHHDVDIEEHLLGDGMEMEANCNCPGNMVSSDKVYEITLAGSPLVGGTSGYGVLTDKIDIDVIGYTDSIESPDGVGLFNINIDEYPTPRASMQSLLENTKTVEGSANVCSESTTPADATPVKRKFKWNVIGATLYIKKAIIGTEIIPSTLVVQNFACLYFRNGGCDESDAQQVSNIWLSGSLSAPLSCIINQGSTIEVNLGDTVNKQYRAKGQLPEGYTLKNVDISYHCDSNAIGNNDRIKLTLSADQGVIENSDALIAKMLDKDDIGVRVLTESNQNVALDGTFEFPVPMDDQGNGVIRIKAAPVSTTDAIPKPGQFEGNVTVKMDLR